MLHDSGRRSDPFGRPGHAGEYSIPIITVSIIGFVHSDVWLSTTSSTKNAIMVGVLVTDILIIITSVLGILGIKKGKPGLLFLFTILVGLFCLVAIGMGTFAAIAPKSLLPDDCVNNNVSWVQDVTTLYGPTNLLCNVGCPCNFTNLNSYSYADQAAIKSKYFFTTGKYLNVQACDLYATTIKINNPDSLLTMTDSLGAM